MAFRPVFVPLQSGKRFVETYNIEFQWYPGMAKSQKQKSIESLHKSFTEKTGKNQILEISSKSKNELGRSLSAFNLYMTTKNTKKKISVESSFQGSKVFEYGGPYDDLLYVDSRRAKKDERLQNSGKLIKFLFFGQEWPLEPKTLFYDWVYLNALYRSPDLSSQVINYMAFTDIEFNPSKSINCQANSAALFVSLHMRRILEEVLLNSTNFQRILGMNTLQPDKQRPEQLSLPGFDTIFE
jgi:type I restriction enzyme M protein